MRAVFAIVLVALVASSHGIDLSGIGKGLIENFKHAGLNIVQGIVDGGKKLFTDSWQTLPDMLSKVLFGKRHVGFIDHLTGFKDRLMGAVNKAKELAAGVFSKAVDKLKELAGKFHKTVGTNTDVDEINKEVDQTVSDHHDKQKRIIAGLIESGKQLFGGLVDKVKNVAGDLFTKAKAKLSEVASGVLQKGAELLAKTGILGKRAVLSLGDHLSNIGKALSPILSPFKDIVSQLGQTLKGHFSNIVETVKGHVSTLGDKLKGHVSDLATHGGKLLEHGKNALSALGEVANDVLKQTLTNAKPHIDGLVKTIGDGAKVVAGHVSGTN